MKKIIFIFIIISNAFFAVAQNTQQIALANEYQNQGEFEKALAIYKKLVSNQQNIPFIHNNYLTVLDKLRMYSDLESYLNMLTRRDPANIIYKVDLIDFHLNQSDSTSADEVFTSLLQYVEKYPNQVRRVAQYLKNKQHFRYTEKVYLAARDKVNDPSAFSIQLANLYRYLNEKDRMIQEYLLFAKDNPGNSRYAKNMLQMTLTEEDDLRSFIQLMMGKIQADPSNEMYSEMIIWAQLQLENFYAAFLQARALDKRSKLPGFNSLEIGELAYSNQDYKTAERIFQYIAETYPQSNNYIVAKNWLIETQEQIIKNTQPVDNEKITQLIASYQNLISESGISKYTLQSMRKKALLHAFYLQEFDSAIQLLERVISSPYSDKELIAQSKLDLGDIYLLDEQPWESKLLYYQVEKSETNTAYSELAKLKNAKLSYYKGDFSLAQEQLDVIKNATGREISNDAINLSLLIQNNTVLDSNQTALRKYSNLEKLLFQNKINQVKDSIAVMVKEFKEHPLLDEIYYLQAKLNEKTADYQQSIESLLIIYKELPYDILTDDALFKIAEIYNNNLNDIENAKEYYQKLMLEFPNSIYISESRKKFRHLRGDYQPQ